MCALVTYTLRNSLLSEYRDVYFAPKIASIGLVVVEISIFSPGGIGRPRCGKGSATPLAPHHHPS